MALGGGTFTAQNKILPGTYINFISKSAAVNPNERGVVAMGLSLNWGASGIFTVTVAEFKRYAYKLFGYNADADEMLNVREIFKHATTLIAYRLNDGGVKASCTYAEALYAGTRGNDITILVQANVDNAAKFDVITKVGTKTVDMQTVAAATDLVKNYYATFKSATLAAGTYQMTGGTNGTVTGTQHQAFLNALESYSFNALGVDTTDATTKALYAAYTKRLRDDLGVKFQTVIYSYDGDYEGIINLMSTVSDNGASAAALVYWFAGAEAGCSLSESLTNYEYDGEYLINTPLTQDELEVAINTGELVFHKVGDSIRVLEDINSLVTFTDEKNSYFSKNDVIRTLDSIATQTAALFNNGYVGKIKNNKGGRTAFWSALVDIHKALEKKGAIEDFSADDLTVETGEEKGSVIINDAVIVTETMEKLYMTVIVA